MGDPAYAQYGTDSIDIEILRCRFLEKQGCAQLNWLIILTEKEIAVVLDTLAQKLNAHFASCEKPLVAVGILKGVYGFLWELTKRLVVPHSVYFIDASSYKGQTQGDVRFGAGIEVSKLKGHHVLLLDELFDSGHTMAAVATALLAHPELGLDGGDLTTCVLFSKNSGTTLAQPDFVGIGKLPNVWFVGYGLDDNGEKRNWPYLFAVPKLPGVDHTDDDAIFEDADFYARVRRKLMAAIVATNF